MNVVKLSIEKPLDEAQWAAGHKVNLLFGPDGSAFATGYEVFDSGCQFAGKTSQ